MRLASYFDPYRPPLPQNPIKRRFTRHPRRANPDHPRLNQHPAIRPLGRADVVG